MKTRLFAAALGIAAWWLAAPVAEAQDEPPAAEEGVRRELPPARPPEIEPTHSERSGALALKVGDYTPERINPGNPSGPQFETIFGDKFRPAFAIEYEYQPLIYRYIGALGVTGTLGYMSASGNTLTAGGAVSAQKETFTIVPASLGVTYHMALFEGQPVVPFAGAGLDYWYFSDAKEGGSGDSVTGGKRGWHWRAGGQILLDWLDPTSAGSMDANWGINNTYLFVEYRDSDMTNFGDNSGFDLSAQTWFGGFMFDL